MARESLAYSLKKIALADAKADRTKQEYKRNIDRFAVWAKGKGIKQVGQVDASVIQEWVDKLEKEGKSPYTIHSYLAPVAKGCGLKMSEVKHPSRTIGTITRGRKTVARAKHDEEREENQRLVVFQRATGIRRSELSRLTPDDLVRDESGYLCVFVKRGKGGKTQKQRILPHNEQTVKEIVEQAVADGHSKLFTKAELNNNINLHGMRANLAKEAYKYALSRVRKEPTIVKQELLDRFISANSQMELKDPERFERSLDRYFREIADENKKYHLRGESRNIALENGLYEDYNRLAVMYVSVFHLSHWRVDVAIKHYLLA